MLSLVKKEQSQKKCLAWNWPVFSSWQNMEKGSSSLASFNYFWLERALHPQIHIELSTLTSLQKFPASVIKSLCKSTPHRNEAVLFAQSPCLAKIQAQSNFWHHSLHSDVQFLMWWRTLPNSNFFFTSTFPAISLFPTQRPFTAGFLKLEDTLWIEDGNVLPHLEAP